MASTSWFDYCDSTFDAVVSRSIPKWLAGVVISLADAEPLVCSPVFLCKYDGLHSVLEESYQQKSTVADELELDLSEFKEATVVEMLRFVFRGETEDLSKNMNLCESLVQLGKKLQFTELLDCCATDLESVDLEVTRDSVGKLFDLAIFTKCNEMMNRCVLRYLRDENLLKEKVEEWISDKRVDVFESLFQFSCGLELLVTDAYDDFSNARAHFLTFGNDDIIEQVLQNMDVLYSDMLVKVSTSPTSEVTYYCHRAILSNSKVLKAMIEGNLMETSERIIVINDSPAEAVGEILYYLYTGKARDLMVQLIEEHTGGTVFMAELVIRKAHEYELPELVDHCRETLIDSELDDGNVLRILGIARLYSLPDLQNRCLEFFYQHRATVTEHPSFEVFVKTDVESLRLAVQAALNCFSTNKFRIQSDLMIDANIDDMDEGEESMIYTENIALHKQEALNIDWKLGFKKKRHADTRSNSHNITMFLIADVSMYSDCQPKITAKIRLSDENDLLVQANGADLESPLDLVQVESEAGQQRLEHAAFVMWPSWDQNNAYTIEMDVEVSLAF